MKRIFQNRIFLLLGAGCMVYVGLGWLGVGGGFTNTDTIVSKVGGSIWLLVGIATAVGLFQKRQA